MTGLSANDAVELLISAGRRPDDAEQLVADWIRTGKLSATVGHRFLSDGTSTVRRLLAAELLPHADKLRRHWSRAAQLAVIVDAIVGPIDTPTD
jgi:hypothetical protein